jgi:filamentous hemagglutinin
MNKHLHRIVFNAARGLRMAVQETARSAGKAASGATPALAGSALALLCAASAHGQIAADPAAPGSQRPTVLVSPGGAALVNIQTPSAAGVSRNVYRQFDVGAEGAVLNNSRTAAQTRLAGQVSGNPWLARGPARIILNEVNSADPSRLRGYVEVAGQRAEVVIANPAGIQVDGAGFINTSRATLTTGAPQLGAAGTLEGFLVRGGTITIDGAGLDAASTDYVAILSRALQVNAGIWASELKAVTGTGRVAADASSMQATAGPGAAPVFALDVSALGGMYAGKITLIGTEAGVGVRNAGHIGAGAGGLVVTASGRLENAGTLEGGRVELAGDDIHNRGGRIRQAGGMALQLAGATVRNTGGGQIGMPPPAVADAGGSAAGALPAGAAAAPDAAGAPTSEPTPPPPAAATAPGSITARGTLHNEGGRIDAAGTIALQAQGIDNAGGSMHLERLSFDGRQFGNAGGRLSVRGDFSASAERFDNTGGQLQADRIAIAVGGDLDNRSGQIAAASGMALKAGTLANADGRIEVAGSGTLAIDAERLDGGNGTLLAGGALELRARDAVHAGHMQAERVAIDTLRLRNSGQIVQTGSAPMQLTASEALDNRGGDITAHGTDMVVRTAHLANGGGSLTHAGTGLLDLHAGRIEGDGGHIASNGALHLRAVEVAHGAGATISAEQITLEATRLANVAGEIVQHGTQAMRLTVGEELLNRDGLIAGNAKDMHIQAGQLANAGGGISHAGEGVLDISVGRLDGGDGRILGNGSLQLQGAQLALAGRVQAQQIAIAAGTLDNRGEIVQTGNAGMQLSATGTLANRGGRIATNAQDLVVRAGKLDNTGGTVAHAGTGQFQIQAGQLDGDAGRIVGHGALQVEAAHIAHGNGASMAAEQITVHARRLDNSTGEIVQHGTRAMEITATEVLDNRGGRIAGHAEDMTLRSALLANAAGRIEHAGNGQLALLADTLQGGDGSIVGDATLAVRATQIAHAGRMQANQLDIQAAGLDNRGGSIVQTGTQAMRIAAAAQIDNRGGRIVGNALAIDIRTAALANAGGEIAHAGTGQLAIAATQMDIGDGRILGNGELRVQADQLHLSGTMQAQGMVVDAGTLTNTGQITQTGDAATMHIRTSGLLDNRGGRIAGNGRDMALQAGHMTNAGGQIAHAGQGQLTLSAARIDGGDGEVIGNGTLALQAASIQNAGRMHAARIAIDTDTLTNNGEIVQTGAGTAHVVVSGTLDNRSGLIGAAAGSRAGLTLSAAQVENQGGRLQADGTLGMRVAGDLQNANGLLRGNGALDIALGGQLHNAGGALEAAGAEASLTLQAAAIANHGGRIVNAGHGASRIAAASIVNAGTGGLVGANGALQLVADTLDNLADAQVSATGALDLAVTQRVRNQGSIASDGSITMAQPNAGLDNSGGSIVAAGPIRIVAAQIQNDEGRIATAGGSHADVALATGKLSNAGGTLSSDRDLRLQVGGDYQHVGTAHAVRNLALAVDGTLRTSGSLRAGGQLAAQALDLDNDAGTRIEADDLDLRIVGALRNAGEIGARRAALHTDALTNRGAITADALAINARTLDNVGPQALIGATQDLTLQATQALSNVDGASIYAGRDILIATGALVNRSATVEAGRHIGIDAATVLNERPGVGVERVVTLEESHTMQMPSWWQNRDRNGRGYTPEGTNYSAYQVFYVNPADILEQSTVYTPDGYAIGRVVLRTHANDSVFFSGRAGLASADGKHWGQAERMTSADGTRVLYYTARQDGAPNPDQVPGTTSGVWDDAQVHTMDTSRVAFNPAYGTCTTTCVRLVTPLDYTDPNTTIIRDTQSVLGPHTSLYELRREAHVTATEDRLAPSAGTAGRIAAGGAIRIGFSGWMLNDHSDIVAGGALALQGADGASFENRATTLLRTWHFDGTHHYANGTSAAYVQPDKTEVIGSIGATLSGQQVDIQAGSIRNIDTSAGSQANLTANLQLSSGSTPQGTAAQRIQNAMLPSTTTGQANAPGAPAGSIAVDGTQVHMQAAAASGQGPSAQTGGLFQLQPLGTGSTLYTTHPRFANAKPWASSDSMLQTLGLDPVLTLKRLGDGFMEQQRIREQVTALTGRRYLAGQDDDDAQYAALLTAGVSFAQALGLRVGVALTAAQMAQLTSDIVWLERQSVTLPDGSAQEVLAPRLYLANLGEGTLRPSGALVTGDDVRLQGQDIVNRGGVIGQASTGRTVLVAGRDIVNQGGVVQGRDVALVAARDVRNESLAITQDWGASNQHGSTAGSHTSLSNTARIEAGRTLQIRAGKDVLDTAGWIGAGSVATVQAGRDIVFGTLNSGHESRLQMGRASVTSSSSQAHAGQIRSGDDLALSAGRDLHLDGTQAHAGGDALLAAGRDLDLQAVASTSSADLRNDPAGSRYRQTHNQTTVQGASVQAGNDVSMRAGALESGDLKVIGSTLSAKGDVQLGASRDVALASAQTSSLADHYTYSKRSGLFSKSTTTQRDVVSVSGATGSSVSGNTVAISAGRDIVAQAALLQSEGAMHLAATRDIALTTANQTVTETHFKDVRKSATGLGKITGLALGGGSLGQTAIVGGKFISSNAALNDATETRTDAIGTTVSAGSLHMASGRDITVQGATVVADHDITALAARNLTIESAQNSWSTGSRAATSRSGSVGTFTNPALGNIKQSQSSQGSGVTHSASRVASLQGDVTLIAGGTYAQTASSVLAAGQGGSLAGGDVHIQARDVAIGEAFNTSASSSHSRSSSTVLGGSASVAGISTDTLRSAGSTLTAMSDTSDGRMQALGAVNLALQGKQAYDTAVSIANGGVGYKVSASISHSKSESQSSASSREAVGSSIMGADRVDIVTTGGATDSNIRVVGSTIGAGSTAHLQADNAIDLQASQSSWEQQGSNRSSGASVGVGFGVGAQNGFTIELGVSKGKGIQNGSEVLHTNTHVTGGQSVRIVSGGDTTLKGAVVDAPRISADVGGDLRIASLQDTSEQIARQSSSGLNLSLCIPPICYGASTASGSAAAAKADGSYASVVEQSGIKAGDGGFQLQVQGGTDLKGGVVSSTQAAIDVKLNHFDTASLSSSDIQNHNVYKASSYAVSASFSVGKGDQDSAKTQEQRGAAKGAAKTTPGGSAGAGRVSVSETSTTSSGISDIAGDTTVRTGDASSTGALVKDWNAQALLKDVEAQARITQEFGQHASRAVGDYAQQKYTELMNSDPSEAAKWAEGGVYRVAAHAAVGGLTGGTGGAMGAALSAHLVPRLGKNIADVDLPAPLKEMLVLAAGTAVGALTGGSVGAAAGMNETANNYLSAADLRNRYQRIKACQDGGDPICEVQVLREYELKSAHNSAMVDHNSVLTKPSLEVIRTALEQSLQNASIDAETRQQTYTSIRELNKIITSIDKAPVLADAAEQTLIAADAIGAASAIAAGRSMITVFASRLLAQISEVQILEKLIAQSTLGKNSPILSTIDAGSVKLVNPTGSTQNCTNCVAVVDNLLRTGNPASALPLENPLPYEALNSIYSTHMSDWATRNAIESSLLAKGEGSRAVVYGTDGVTGHVWNAVVQQGKVNYIDGQLGGSGLVNFKDFNYFRFGILP